MRKVWILLKTDIINSLSLNSLSYKSSNKNRNVKKSIMTLFIMLIITLSSLLYMGGSAYFLGDLLLQSGNIQLLAAISLILPFVIMIPMFLYKMPSSLFAFKDYELLVSMPLSDKTILSAKLISLLLEAYIWQFLIGTPVFIVYLIKIQVFSLPALLIYLSLFIVTPIIPGTVSALVSMFVNIVGIKFKNKHIFAIIFTFTLSIAVLLFSFKSPDFITIEFAETIINTLLKSVDSFFIFKLYLMSFQQKILSLILLLLINIAIFYLLTMFTSKVFRRINAKSLENAKQSFSFQKRISVFRENSPLIALIKREWVSYTHNVLYLVNTAFGLVLLVTISILSVFVDISTLFASMDLPEFDINIDNYKFIVVVVTCAFSLILSPPTSVSISLEGSKLWISKSMPILPKDIFLSKILFSCSMSVPVALISSLLFSFSFDLGYMHSMLLIVFNISMAVFASVYGLYINLLLPKMHFKSPVEVVKQSASVMVAVFTGMGMTAVIYILAALVPLQYQAFVIAAFALLFILLVFAIWKWLKTRGAARFSNL